MVKLKGGDEMHLEGFIRKGHQSARALTRARILLLVQKGKRERDIVDALGVGRSTIWRVKKRYIEGGLENALYEKPRPGQPRKYTDKHEAEIIALACTTPPEGRKRWSLALLAEELVKKKGFETINRESIRLVLKKAKRSPG